MAITRYAGDRFVVDTGDTKPTGVFPGAFLTDTGNLKNYIKTGYTVEAWALLSGQGGGGSTTPSAPLNSVQFNNGGSFSSFRCGRFGRCKLCGEVV